MSYFQDSMNALGLRIRTAREQRGLSQSDVRALGGPSRQTLSILENGQSDRPDRFTIQSLLRVLFVNRDWLLTGQGQPFPETLGARLRAAREAVNFSQHEACVAIGSLFPISPSLLQVWENDEEAPSASQLLELATIYMISVDLLEFGMAPQNGREHRGGKREPMICYQPDPEILQRALEIVNEIYNKDRLTPVQHTTCVIQAYRLITEIGLAKSNLVRNMLNATKS